MEHHRKPPEILVALAKSRCSGCGSALSAGEMHCPKCGHPVQPVTGSCWSGFAVSAVCFLSALLIWLFVAFAMPETGIGPGAMGGIFVIFLGLFFCAALAAISLGLAVAALWQNRHAKLLLLAEVGLTAYVSWWFLRHWL